MPDDKDPYEKYRISNKKKNVSNEDIQISKVPPPLRTLKGSSWTPTHREEADFKKWARHDLWRIEEAIMLLLGLEPFDVKSDYWNEPPEYNDLYKLAIGSEAIGTLKFHNTTQVQPSVFIKWALSKDIDVPEELAALAMRLDTDTVENKQVNLSVPKGVSKQEISEVFDGLHFDKKKWSANLADPPKWLKDCRVMMGSARESALWNPVDIAIALNSKDVQLWRLDKVFTTPSWEKWNDEWIEKSSFLRQ